MRRVVEVSDPRSDVVDGRSLVTAELARRIAAWAQMGVSLAVIVHELRLSPRELRSALASLSGGTAPCGEGAVGSLGLAAGVRRVAGESPTAGVPATVAAVRGNPAHESDLTGCRRPRFDDGAGQWGAP